MATPFNGMINVDIRDSEPDWDPFEPSTAPPRWTAAGSPTSTRSARRERC
jgi:hypothetical protein